MESKSLVVGGPGTGEVGECLAVAVPAPDSTSLSESVVQTPIGELVGPDRLRGGLGVVATREVLEIDWSVVGRHC